MASTTAALKMVPVTSEIRAAVENGTRARWWRRRGSKKSGFHYVDADGKRISDAEHLERIKGLAIPPAWREVRISPRPTSKLQAVGVDYKGRVQYRYHPSFEAQQQRQKYAKVERFGEHLPELRRATARHLDQEGLTKERVLAVVVRLMNDLYFRVGSERSARHHRTYGVTTLRNRHLELRSGGRLVFSFKGKSGIRHRQVLVDEDLAEVMRELKKLGGPRLFEYVDEEGRIKPILSRDVNAYVKDVTSDEFSCKDFRTWGGSLLCAVRLAETGAEEDPKRAERNVVRAVKHVAEHLGNTPAVCRASYVHPVVIERYLDGVTIDEFRPRRERRVHGRYAELDPEERALLKLLREARAGNGRGRTNGNGRAGATA